MKLAVQYEAFEAKCRYSLLALPVDLLPMIADLEIRGSLADSAVMCTRDTTFSLRGVQSSNSLLLCSKTDNKVTVSASLNETLEVVPARAKTDRLLDLLRGTEYTGEDAPPPSKQVDLSDLQSLLPASDLEIIRSLRTYGAILIKLQARLVPPMYLRSLLSALLKALPLTKEKTASIDAEDAEMTFDALDCGAEACHAILDWFADLSDNRYQIELTPVVREIGVCLLAEGGYAERPLEPFMADWRSSVGPFEKLCDSDLLRSTALVQARSVTFYPRTRLSADPATRFGELFGARPKWREADLVPFLEDFGAKKERDKLVMKFVRKVREKEGDFWVSRNNW